MRLYRLGTTSCIVPDEILPNVQLLAGRVEDVELVIFELDDGRDNLLAPADVRELAAIGAASGLSYTVHLPLDLQLGAAGDPLHRSLEKAQSVIERTWPLDPWAYVLHLDGKEADEYMAWVEQAANSLEICSKWVDDPRRLAVENLEGYPLDFLDPVLDRVPVSRCLDIGHLWLEGHDPVPFLRAHLDRVRVVHLHGVGTRDHQSLAHMEQGELAAVLAELEAAEFDGVLTLEVFSREDLGESMEALRQAGLTWPAS